MVFALLSLVSGLWPLIMASGLVYGLVWYGLWSLVWSGGVCGLWSLISDQLSGLQSLVWPRVSGLVLPLVSGIWSLASVLCSGLWSLVWSGLASGL